MYPIASVSLGAGAGSFQFTSIPQTFTHLQMRYYFRGSDAGAISFLNVYLNGNAYTTDYSCHTMAGDGASAYATGTANAGGIGALYAPGASSTANCFAAGVVDVLDYTDTSKFKTTRVLTGYDANGAGQAILGSGVLRSTAAITSLGIFNFTSVANCRVDLYGISTSNATGA
jgi:hypothetical protein